MCRDVVAKKRMKVRRLRGVESIIFVILPLRALASTLIYASLICLVSVLLVEHSPYFFVLFFNIQFNSIFLGLHLPF